ncbi:MAG: CDP-glucose 4,6-dehydratase, partial [Pseudomonadota bacterium]
MAIDPGFWNGRRVFLTGHSGFKGTWLAAWLVEMGADVTGYSLAPRLNPSLYAMAGLDRRTRGLTGDIRERHTLAAAMRLSDPEVIFHLAAQPYVRSGLRDPRGTFETNVMGTVNLLDVARSMPSLKAIVTVTSDKCYERTSKPCRERDPLGGAEPYGASKAACEHVISAYRNCFFATTGQVGLASARAGNVIGGGDFGPHRLLPDIIRAVAASKPVVLRHPDSVRPWQHVLDALSGYLELTEALFKDPKQFGDSYNFGPPN